jgi:hypothetical protein
MVNRFALIISIISIISIITLIGCNRTFISVPTSPSNSSTTPAVITSKIEFRVNGNAVSARIRYTTERDGIIQTVSTLPFFATFSTTTDNMFLNLEVTPTGYSGVIQYPFMSAQIFVNGDLFREVTSNEFFLNTITVSGTWRR